MKPDLFTKKRKSYLDLGDLFFWTATLSMVRVSTNQTKDHPFQGSCLHEPNKQIIAENIVFINFQIQNMKPDLFTIKRKGYLDLGNLFFWTATINNWQRLLLRDENKQIIINSLTYLADTGKIDVFGFVIMPNHIHLIWRINELNGKETTQGSFLKYTAHEFKKVLRTDEENNLSTYAVNAHNKGHEFWQRDSLAIHLFNKEIAYQKLDYIHFNPCAEYWNLANEPVDYFYSSAKYYETGSNDFSFLKDLRNEIG